MLKVLLPEDMRRLDAYMIGKKEISGVVLMENAAFGISALIRQRFHADTRIFAVCGTGNNGGDGFAATRQLKANGYTVKAVLLGKASDLKGDALENAKYLIGEKLLQEAADEETLKWCIKDISAGDVVIDALFGTGLARDVTGLNALAVRMLNESGAYIVAADIPSGIHSETGQILGTAVKADDTVTFQYAKPGHFIYPGREYCGRLHVAKIGCDDGFPGFGAYDFAAYPPDTKAIRLQRRRANTHKGSYGSLAVLAGGKGYTGAGILCVTAALKSGAGLVTAGIPASIAEVYQKKLVEAITFPVKDLEGRFYAESIADADRLMAGKDALAAGPGLTNNDDMIPFVRHIVCGYDVKKVLDADALNLISKEPEMLKEAKGRIVLTPHPREFSRLTGKSVPEILEDPVKAASGFAKEYGVTLLLKGATTVVATEDRVSFVLAGSPGMAKGGSGDVLTGMIGGLLAQGLEPHEAAVTGAHICGLAGEKAAEAEGEYAMTATDTIKHLKDAIKAVTERE
jgi:hydroxyethylthiazole kinase-like uncharacterized protein yjeF